MMSCAKQRGLTVKVGPLGCQRVSFIFSKVLLKELIRVPEPVPTSGSRQNPRTVEEHSIHAHLHANVAMPNSCCVDDIYCCDSFTVAMTGF